MIMYGGGGWKIWLAGLACLQDAGTDVSAVQECQAKFGP
jgi:hypothetical protein